MLLQIQTGKKKVRFHNDKLQIGRKKGQETLILCHNIAIGKKSEKKSNKFKTSSRPWTHCRLAVVYMFK